MFPVLFRLGSWEIRSYFVFLSLGLITAYIIGWREARKAGFSKAKIILFYVAVLPIALFLGMINGWLINSEFYWGLLHGRLILYGGLVSYGIVFGLLLTGAVYARIIRQPVRAMLNLIVPVMPLMLAISRIGCLLNGCCYGMVTTGFGGLFLPDIYGHWATRYPIQIFLIILDLALFIWLWIQRKRKVAPRSLVVPFLFWLAAGRLVIDSLREFPGMVLGLSYYQWEAILILGVVTIVAIVQKMSKNRTVNEPSPL